MDAHLSLSSTVLVTARRAGLRAGQDNTVNVLVRIQAPAAPAGHAAERPPQALALVIDRSGSMQGRPLDEARRCAEYVVSQLRPTDAVSLVQFDNRVQRLWPAAPVGDGAPLRAALAGIAAGGSTDLHGGWQEGAQTLSEVGGSGLKRVVLLSDGQANCGETDAGVIAAECAALAARGIGTSTYGLGRGFNEELMVAMARSGGGNHYYGDTAEDLMEPFQQELDLLDNLCLRELTLSVSAADGVLVEMVNQFPIIGDGWRLPDLAWGAEAWAVLRLKVGELVLPATGKPFTLLRVAVSGRSLSGEPVQLERIGLTLPVLSGSAFDDLEGDEGVARRLTELAAAQALSDMRIAAAAGDWDKVDRLLQEATRQFAGNEWVAAVLASMTQIAEGRSRERLMKEAMYSSGKLRGRLVAADEPDAYFASQEFVSVPSYLRRKPSQGKGNG